MAGIVGYGAFIPRNRIKAAEIARQWGKDPKTALIESAENAVTRIEDFLKTFNDGVAKKRG